MVIMGCRGGWRTCPFGRLFSRRFTELPRNDKLLPPLVDDLALDESCLDSLCFAILVARLEDITGRDPFASATGQNYPRTVGDLIALYEVDLV